MTQQHLSEPIEMPRSLDVSGARAIHADLAEQLRQGNRCTIKLVGDGAVAPLALQVLVSAERAESDPPVALCDAAQRALASAGIMEG